MSYSVNKNEKESESLSPTNGFDVKKGVRGPYCVGLSSGNPRACWGRERKISYRKKIQREKERERGRGGIERDRQTDRQTDRQRQRETWR